MLLKPLTRTVRALLVSCVQIEFASAINWLPVGWEIRAEDSTGLGSAPELACDVVCVPVPLDPLLALVLDPLLDPSHPAAVSAIATSAIAVDRDRGIVVFLPGWLLGPCSRSRRS
jgi:hypothetical protein